MEHHTVPTTVLWDIDGTLVLNAVSPGNLYHLALERAVGRDLALRVGHQHGRTDAGLIAEHVRAHDFDDALIPTVSGHLRDLTDERFRAGDHRKPAPGARDLVRRFAVLGWRNGLLTGNSEHRARVKLRGAGFDLDAFDWAHSFFGDEEVDRAGVTDRAAAALRGERAVIVGDTPRDGEAADAAGIPFLAVATGVYDVEALRATSAVVVARDCVEDVRVIEDAIAGLAPLG
ncbi:phosphoglycolate phosphatase-like HAD superfamily hydrolase [Curtobacterium luteum]|uniref:Haloacid dehalogenase n=2 Tax=Curtobacterium TaxID=2034 RepID=A0A8H9KYG5_9MICO|nr:HAD family hydrolase [Curtobacterium luteum]MBM7801254.1 phosphoglycolate phosphatase-like HAD superfamily hydrolase [Curtobacterium luteum]NUU51196.1 HAD family hydrolase [Curtobacterium luteum]GGK95646.1 haloacid dehalogenase [Curtobacterium luteum]